MLALQRKHPAHSYTCQAHVLTNNRLGTSSLHHAQHCESRSVSHLKLSLVPCGCWPIVVQVRPLGFARISSLYGWIESTICGNLPDDEVFCRTNSPTASSQPTSSAQPSPSVSYIWICFLDALLVCECNEDALMHVCDLTWIRKKNSQLPI